MYVTEDRLTAMRLKAHATNSPEYILRQLIDKHDTREMERGVSYYHNENTILDREIFFYDENGQKVVDRDATNHRIPHNWHKLIVDQKVGYLLGKPVVFNAEPDQYADELNAWFDEEFDDKIIEIGKNASNKGVEYLHPYIDEGGQFRFVVIPAEQVIPIYDTDYQEEIVELIRFYTVWVNEEERLRAEWWTKRDVTYFLEDSNGNFMVEQTDGPNPDSHFYYNGKGYGWERVPFIEFRNNEEKYSDLKYYRQLIDVYDLVVSDLANDVTGIQKLIYVLKGYGGTDLNEFMENLKYYRAIKVDGQNGGVDLAQADVPIEAIQKFLDKAEENIFLFGQGVNIKTDKFGASPSGIALKFLFHLLDLKANVMARKFSFAIKSFAWFLTEYLAISGKYKPPKDAVDQVRVTFSKSMLVNDLELVQMALQSKGVISDDTIVANHPWVEDAQAEKERLEQDQGLNLDSFEDEEEDQEG